MNRRMAWLLGALLLCLGSGGAGAEEKLTYNQSWLPQGSQIGPIVALSKGWFREAGLDVTIVRGYGGQRTANELDQGQFEIGYVDPISLVLTRSNGGHIRLVGAINTQWPASICALTERFQLQSIEDLKGRVLGGGASSPVHNVVPAWLELNGKPREFIRLVRLDPAVIPTSLIEGKIDLVECWKGSDRPVMVNQAAKAGMKVNWLSLAENKLDAYGSGFAVSEDTLAKRGDAVRSFLRAAYRGYEFAIAQPAEAADLLVKMYPLVDRQIALDQIREISEQIQDPAARGNGLGFLRAERMKSTLAFVDRAFDLKGKVAVEDMYSNAFLR